MILEVFSYLNDSKIYKWCKAYVESLSLEVSKKRVDVALRDVVSGHGEGGLMVRLDGLRGLFQT